MGQYTIRVDKLGDTKIDAEGFVGESCKDATAAVELALAGTTKTEHKPEFYDTETGEKDKNLAF